MITSHNVRRSILNVFTGGHIFFCSEREFVQSNKEILTNQKDGTIL